MDPQELRFSLLFWDRLAWPSSRALYFAGGPDEQFLEQAGILTRPSYTFDGDFAQRLAQTHIQAFRDLEQREPGAWSLAQGETSLLLRDHILEEGRGSLVELHRAIPVPDKDVPLNEILEFRTKHHDELLRLRSEIDSFFVSVNAAVDKGFELGRHIGQIDSAAADILRVGKEWKFPVRLSDLKSSFDFQPHTALLAAAGGWEWGKAYEMPLATAAVAVAAASIKFGTDFGMRGLKIRTSPYRYVYEFHKEVF